MWSRLAHRHTKGCSSRTWSTVIFGATVWASAAIVAPKPAAATASTKMWDR
jgi:hypothetical protein